MDGAIASTSKYIASVENDAGTEINSRKPGMGGGEGRGKGEGCCLFL